MPSGHWDTAARMFLKHKLRQSRKLFHILHSVGHRFGCRRTCHCKLFVLWDIVACTLLCRRPQSRDIGSRTSHSCSCRKQCWCKPRRSCWAARCWGRCIGKDRCQTGHRLHWLHKSRLRCRIRRCQRLTRQGATNPGSMCVTVSFNIPLNKK